MSIGCGRNVHRHQPHRAAVDIGAADERRAAKDVLPYEAREALFIASIAATLGVLWLVGSRVLRLRDLPEPGETTG